MMLHAVLLCIRYIFEFLLSGICTERIALFVVMLPPFQKHIDKKCYSKIHGIDKENWVSNIFSACNRLKKFARNNKKPYYELNASNSTPWWSHVPTLSINLYVLQLIEIFCKIKLVTIFILTNVEMKSLPTFSKWCKNLIMCKVKEIYDINIERTNIVHRTNSPTWLND